MDLLKAKALSWDSLIASMLASDEFLAKYEQRSKEVRALASLHRARIQLFQQYLPTADTVVDLGGASRTNPEGALFEMGYPHAPKELIVIDLPPKQRFGKGAHRESTLRASRGTAIRYLHRTMSDLSGISSGSVDLVVSGESIEHIPEDEADHACRQAFRVLRPGGHFCLDTPNARLTRVQSPDVLIHLEHKREYYVEEIRTKLTAAGFTIAKEKGITPMPVSLASGIFDLLEMERNCSISDDAESCYLFFFDAVKPV